MSLAEMQSAMRDALVMGESERATPFIDPRWSSRLAIHQRNYEASLVAAIVARFPATEWLIGVEALQAAACAFVHGHPPTAPCIAEYAQGFPAFIAAMPGAAALQYLYDFAELDWHQGRIAIAVDAAAPDAVHYLYSPWPIDRLMAKFLNPDTPDEPFEPEDIWLEVRGSRGAFAFHRLSPEEFHERTVYSA